MNVKNKKQSTKKFLVIAVALAVITGLAVGGVYAYQLLNPKAPQTSDSKPVASDNPLDAANEGTDETEVTQDTLSSYIVAGDMPRFLEIEKLNMKARIQEMGINTDGAVQAPVNIHDSGWYKGSAKPGTPGAAFIDGHASGATRQGLFAYIDTLKNGDTMTVEQGDGAVFTYKVVHIETVQADAVDMNKALSVYNGAEEGLNLMTCTGKWVADKETYDKRVVVYTERIS